MGPLRQGTTGIAVRLRLERSDPLAQYKPSEREKQLGLNTFATMLDTDTLQKCHRTLVTGLANHWVGDDDQADVQDLFVNRSSLFAKTCTRSGSLALAAFAFKLFGQSLLDDSTHRLDQDKLKMALHMLFGKAMPTIQSDLVMDFTVRAITGSEFVLTNSGYSIVVAPIQDLMQRHDAIENFVTATNVNGRYFRTQTETAVLAVLASDAGIPAVISVQLPFTAQESAGFGASPRYWSTVQSSLTDGSEILSTTTLQYPLVENILSDQSDADDGDEEYLKAVPDERGAALAWQLRFDCSIGEVNTTSQFCAVAAKKKGNSAEQLRTAELVVHGMFPDLPDEAVDHDEHEPGPVRRRPVLVDIRLLSEQGERSSHLEHTRVMRTACNQAAQPVTYFPLFQATHSASTRLSMRNEPVPDELVSSPSIRLGQSTNQALIRLITDAFEGLPFMVRYGYKDVFNHTVALIAATQHRVNAIPLATFLSILFDVFKRHATESTPEFGLCIGCERATGKTASVLTGVAMLQSLILHALESNPYEHLSDQLFSNSRHTVEPDYRKLGPEQGLFLAALYDTSVLAITVDPLDDSPEPDDQALRAYFSGLPFVTVK